MTKPDINSVLFVCLGNICRSPLAEAIAHKLTVKYNLNIKCDSAGTGHWHIGEAPCINSQIVAKNNGLDISSFRARQVTTGDFKEFDIIIALDKSNLETLKQMGCNKPVLLGSFGFNSQDVPDPYFFDGFEGFDKVFNMIEESVNILFEEEILTKAVSF